MLMLNFPRAFTLDVLVTPPIPGSYVYNMYIQDQSKYVIVIKLYTYSSWFDFWFFFFANLRDRGSHDCHGHGFYSPNNLIFFVFFCVWYEIILLYTCSWIIFICNMYKMEGVHRRNTKIVSFPSMWHWSKSGLEIIFLSLVWDDYLYL